MSGLPIINVVFVNNMVVLYMMNPLMIIYFLVMLLWCSLCSGNSN